MTPAVIAGLDEAGRGALAGPVVAAACIVSEGDRRHLRSRVRITDSKLLTPGERLVAFRAISMLVPYGVGIVNAGTIDDVGILTATEMAMQRAILNLSRRKNPTYLLVDGRDKFWFDIPHSSVVHGDRTEFCISTASIIAKVVRDRIMVRSDSVFPGYAFALHKGYGTTEHKERIHALKPCPIHRRSFLQARGSQALGTRTKCLAPNA
jgi:ribonuclease HII